MFNDIIFDSIKEINDKYKLSLRKLNNIYKYYDDLVINLQKLPENFTDGSYLHESYPTSKQIETIIFELLKKKDNVSSNGIIVNKLNNLSIHLAISGAELDPNTGKIEVIPDSLLIILLKDTNNWLKDKLDQDILYDIIIDLHFLIESFPMGNFQNVKMRSNLIKNDYPELTGYISPEQVNKTLKRVGYNSNLLFSLSDIFYEVTKKELNSDVNDKLMALQKAYTLVQNELVNQTKKTPNLYWPYIASTGL